MTDTAIMTNKPPLTTPDPTGLYLTLIANYCRTCGEPIKKPFIICDRCEYAAKVANVKRMWKEKILREKHAWDLKGPEHSYPWNRS